MATSSSRFRSGTKAFGTEKCMTHIRYVYSEKIQATHVPKSAIIRSDEGPWYGKPQSVHKKATA